MRTLLLLLMFLGLGFGVAKFTHYVRHRSETIVLGLGNLSVEEAADQDALLAAIQGAVPKKSGKIEVVNGMELDFGLMLSGTKRSHKFIFKNVGEAAAQIRFVRSTCKCTVGKFERAVLKPGEETEVELEWRAEGKGGEFSQSATIETDCPDQEEIKLSITGEVIQGYVFDPSSKNLGDIFTNVETSVSVTIYTVQDRPMELVEGRPTSEELAEKVRVEIGEERQLQPGEIPDKADARYAVDVKITLLKGLPSGPLLLPIQFLRKSGASSEDEPEIPEFSIVGRCINDVRIIAGDDYDETRNIYNLGSAKTSQGLKKKLLVAIRREGADADPNLRVATIVPSQIKASVGEPSVSANQRIYAITLEIPPGSEPIEFDGSFSKDFGRIVIETDIESSPKIPIYLKLKVTE
jgi:hypothetical protein